MKTNYVISDYFQKIDCEEKAYWAGFILGDGNLYNGVNRYTITLGLNSRDEGHLDKFASAVKWANKKYYNEKTDAVYLVINNKKMYQDLVNLGITAKKSLTAEWPKVPKKYEMHFLRGLFDADGSIHLTTHQRDGRKYNCPRFNLTGTKDCLLQAIRILKLNGVPKKHGQVYRISKEGGPSVHLIYLKLYKDSTVWLDRKKEKFEFLHEE